MTAASMSDPGFARWLFQQFAPELKQGLLLTFCIIKSKVCKSNPFTMVHEKQLTIESG